MPTRSVAAAVAMSLAACSQFRTAAPTSAVEPTQRIGTTSSNQLIHAEGRFVSICETLKRRQTWVLTFHVEYVLQGPGVASSQADEMIRFEYRDPELIEELRRQGLAGTVAGAAASTTPSAPYRLALWRTARRKASTCEWTNAELVSSPMRLRR